MRRLLAAVAGVALAHATGVAALAALAPRPEPGPILPAAGGELRELGIQFHAPGADRFLPVFGSLLSALDPSTTVRVAISDEADRALFDAAHASWFPTGGGPTVDYVLVGEPITSWSRDRLAVLAPGTGAPTFLVPAAPQYGADARVHDYRVPWAVAERVGATVRTARYRFDGGDLIADAERVYVATPLLDRNPGWDPDDLLAEVARDVGLPVLHLGAGGVTVPEHHIGMFVTPLGGGRVGVGDPDLALAVLREAGVDPGTLVVDGLPLPLDTTEATLDRFRHVADGIRAAGLTPVPLPLLPSTTPYVWISYDNVLLEHRGDALHVYLPTYGVPALDAAATRIWEGEGAVVHPIPAQAVFRLGGSVRCLTAPLL